MAERRTALFLRGINVGRAKRISMAELARLVEGLGTTDVRTLLNSGNVVCTTSRSPAALARGLGAALRDELGLDVSVVARTRPELAAVVAHDPLREVVTNDSRYLVVLLDREPDPSDVDRLLSVGAGTDVCAHAGRELYVWMPEGVAESPVSTALAKKALGPTVWTGRNWSTVTKVLDAL